jgi:cell division protein FtsB
VSKVIAMTGSVVTKSGAVERAVRAELRQLRCTVATDGSAALAVSLARQIDISRGAVAAAAAAAQLRALLTDLRAEAAKVRPERDVIDEIGSRRASKSAAG